LSFIQHNNESCYLKNNGVSVSQDDASPISTHQKRINDSIFCKHLGRLPKKGKQLFRLRDSQSSAPQITSGPLLSSPCPQLQPSLTNDRYHGIKSCESSPAWTDDDKFLQNRPAQRVSPTPNTTVISRQKRHGNFNFGQFDTVAEESMSNPNRRLDFGGNDIPSKADYHGLRGGAVFDTASPNPWRTDLSDGSVSTCTPIRLHPYHDPRSISGLSRDRSHEKRILIHRRTSSGFHDGLHHYNTYDPTKHLSRSQSSMSDLIDLGSPVPKIQALLV
jgi:hypothetical protein